MAKHLINLNIGGRRVGQEHPCFIIAEAGVNHNGDINMALDLIDVAARSGADAVKFQTFNAERLATREAPKARYQLETTDLNESQVEMLRKLELTPMMHQQLLTRCQEHGIIFMSSPFDIESADLLDDLEVPAFKIPSGEITNLPYLSHIAAKGRPMIVSTGMAYLSEVETAVRVIREAGNEKFILLHCVSNYPANAADINLRAMATMAQAFGVPVGYSDHTTGIEISLAAVAIGACVIEKHFTIDRNLPGPDHRASLEPDELITMISGIRNVESALGHGRKEPVSSEANTATMARKSIVASQDLPAGAELTADMIDIKRPGNGLPPTMLSFALGRRLKISVPRDTLLTLEMFE